MKTGEIRLVRFHTRNGIRSAFVKKGRKFIKVVTIDAPISVTKVRVAEERFMTPLKKNDDFYPYARGVSKFIKASKTLGITKGAKAIILAAKGLIPYDENVDTDGIVNINS